jgi:putative ABC transport system permease protein
MKTLNILLSAYRALIRNKMRTLLTMLGMIIGVGAVIIMLAIGEGAQETIKESINSLGSNILILMPGSFNSGGVKMGAGSMSSLTEDDITTIGKECSAVKYITPLIRASGQAIYGNMNWSSSTQGVNPEYLEIRQWKMAFGDMFTDADIKASTKVCVLGQTVVTNLFGEDGDPVDQTIRIRNKPFRVVGVLAKKGQNAEGTDQDDIILAPYTTVQKRLSRFPFIGSAMISCVSAEAIPEATNQVSELLRMRHKIQSGDADDFTIKSQADIASMRNQTNETMTVLLACIAGVSLLVGGIGIMNIMLVSVTERTREIGIRMSVGAKSRDILTQFLIEAIVLSMVGGTLGIILGVGGSKILTKALSWQTLITTMSVLVSFGFSLMIGVFFGWYPARKAAMLDPIDALRYE